MTTITILLAIIAIWLGYALGKLKSEQRLLQAKNREIYQLKVQIRDLKFKSVLITYYNLINKS